MQLFLGDAISLMKEGDEPTMVTGRVTGIVLDDENEVERVYIHGITMPFWMNDNWLFMDIVDEEEE